MRLVTLIVCILMMMVATAHLDVLPMESTLSVTLVGIHVMGITSRVEVISTLTPMHFNRPSVRVLMQILYTNC